MRNTKVAWSHNFWESGCVFGNPQNPERFLFFKSLLSSSIIVINSVLFASFWPYLKRHTPWPQHGFRLKIQVLQSRTPFAGGHAEFMSMVWGKVANQNGISESYQSHISHVCFVLFSFVCFHVSLLIFAKVGVLISPARGW